MPIQFRCTSCNQKLAISRRKAGKMVTCPACAADLQVPTIEEATAGGQVVESPPQVDPPRQPETPPEPPPEPAAAEPSAEEQFFEDFAPAAFEDLDEEFVEEEETPPPAVEPESRVAAAAEPPPTEEPRSEPPQEAAAAGPRRWSDEEEEEEDGFHLARSPIDESGLDMTPMVDVTFLLLIFFMITASFSIQKSMEAEAPEPDQEGAAQMPSMDDLADDSVIVEIDENDVIYVDDTQVATIGELIEQLELKIGSEQKREMIIEPHPMAKHGTVVQATDAGIEVGMQRIRRVTRKGE